MTHRGLLLLLFVSLPMAAQSLDAAFAKLDRLAPQFHSYAADMKHLVHTAVINDDSIDNGTIKVKRDKGKETRVLINITGADAKTVWVDSLNVNIFSPKLNTVDVYNIGDKRAMLDKFLLLGFGATSVELKETYDVSYIGPEIVAGVPADHIVLIPKTADILKQIKRAELWIGPNGLPVQQKAVTSTTGDYSLFTYSNPKLNPPLSDNALKLNYPKDVKIEHPGR
jgi:outer membrane lipoprotein-sorting protein